VSAAAHFNGLQLLRSLYCHVMYQIDSGFNKAVYSGNFLKTLIPKINRKAADPKLAEEVDALTHTTL
jgi:hypothetical protein